MEHYYFNLPKNNQLKIEINRNVSRNIQKIAKQAFEPFEVYLQNAITALEKKQNIEAKWKKIKTDNLAELCLVGKLFRFPKQVLVRIKDENIVNQLKGKTKIDGIGKVHKIKSIDGTDVVLDSIPKEDGMLFLNNKIIEFEVVKSKKPEGVIIQDNEEYYIIYDESGQKPNESNAIEIPQKNIGSFVNFEDLKFEDGKKLNAERNENLSVILLSKEDYGKIVFSDKLKFKIEKIKSNNQDTFWIQLIEKDESDDDISGFSPLKYFFDDGVEIEDDKGNKYQIVKGYESENRIVLKKKNNKGKREFTFPPDDSILKVKVNTYQLRKQIEAISLLMNMPIGEHSKLIRLFENKNKSKWNMPTDEKIKEWYVITDDKRSGCQEQRNFIYQAINTPDFAILEGPPGSGKTTVILELICQLVQGGKRILLCGSTHVAIDNVLERLKEKRNEDSLLEKFHILPVRIGDEKRISGDIREFQIDNLVEDNDINEKLLLEISNLVCGTTIGILQHPKFKERKGTLRNDNGKLKYYSDEPIIPEFDYLIIDESSKTTFQEFLVPALYAKKWILVGDVMQLSPFTERDEIVSNLENLCIDGVLLSIHKQQASFYMQKLKEISRRKGYYNKFVLPVEFEVLGEIEKEIKYETEFNKFIAFIYRENIGKLSKLELSATDFIFIDKNLLEKCWGLIPESHAILRSRQWQQSEHAFVHNTYQKSHKFSYKERGRESKESFELVDNINAYFEEKSWAKEIAWRIDREHQIRLTNNSKLKGNYERAIQGFIPKSLDKDRIKDKVEKQINMVASMAFPSILESLVKGISGRKLRFETTISEGFNDEHIRYRKTTLKYQHRMHPEISVFPREQFYKKEEALLDLEAPKSIKETREWEYNKYPNRSVWLNVDGKTERNRNQDEIKCLIKELEAFLEYAKNNPQPEGKEWSVACLTFYRGQESRLREELQKLTKNENAYSNFSYKEGSYRIEIKLHTVDKFQGQEADVVFLSMVQTTRDGFLDNPNRLNVAITRAKFQLVIIGKYDYYSNKSNSIELKTLAQKTYKI